MSKFDVTHVQETLRRAASMGHDLISRPGNLILHDKQYPLTYGHMLRHEGEMRTVRSLIPLGETGNAAFVSTNWWNDSPKGDMQSTIFLHPYITEYKDNYQPPTHHFSGSFEHYDLDKNRESKENPNVLIDEFMKRPPQVTVSKGWHPDITKQVEEQHGHAMLKNFNALEASRDLLSRWHLDNTPDWGVSDRDLSQHVQVYYAPNYGRDYEAHLYHPDSEVMKYIGTTKA